MLHFALGQCVLTYRYVCAWVEKRSLKAVVLRENMVNLITLIHTFGRIDPEVSEPVAEQLQKFICNLEDLDRQLAELSNLPSLNWQSIMSALKTAVQEHKAFLDPRPLADFVPSIDDFTEIKLLGKVAFGAVYKAIFKGDLKVALKVIPQLKFRFDPRDDTPYIDRMIASVVMNHPYICQIYCSFIASAKDQAGLVLDSPTLGTSVTVMEVLDGVDLTERIGKNSSLTANLTQVLMQQCMMAIEHLHLSGCIHRNIKPANIMVMRDGRLKLIDFDESWVCICHTGNQFQMSYFSRTAVEFSGRDKAGTEAYMAPEVHRGKAFGRASDWWSVGIVHFRLAFGRLPFRNQQIVEQIVNKELEWDRFGDGLDGHFTALKNYLFKILAKESRNRLGSRDYSEIFEHPLFADVDWQKLPEQVTWYEELDVAFANRYSIESDEDRQLPGS